MLDRNTLADLAETLSPALEVAAKNPEGSSDLTAVMTCLSYAMGQFAKRLRQPPRYCVSGFWPRINRRLALDHTDDEWRAIQMMDTYCGREWTELQVYDTWNKVLIYAAEGKGISP